MTCKQYTCTYYYSCPSAQQRLGKLEQETPSRQTNPFDHQMFDVYWLHFGDKTASDSVTATK